MEEITKDTKRCPYCKEGIKFDAIKCKYCKEFLDKPADVARNTGAKEQKLSAPVLILGTLLVVTSGYYFGLIGGGISGVLLWLISKSSDSETTKIVAVIFLWIIIAFVGYSLTEI